MSTAVQKTRACPYCRETIAIEAIKCRWCAEFIERDEAIADAESSAERLLFEAQPSLLGLAGPVLRGALVIAAAIFLMVYPIEEMGFFGIPDTAGLWRVRVAVGAAVASLVIGLLAFKALRMKMTRYEVTSERIEHSRGVFERHIDNIDMFRVIDLRLRRSILDCILGLGTVELITTDKTDPEFIFEKVSGSRLLYETIKKASLAADRTNRVVHLQ